MNQPTSEYPSLKQLYPSLSPEELRVASENIDRYLQVILRICKHMESEEEARQDDDRTRPSI